MARVLAVLSWIGVVLVGALHVAFWRGVPLGGATLAGLVVGFAIAIVVLVGLILAVQKAAAAPGGAIGQAYFQVVPGWARAVLLVAFIYVALHFVDWLPIAGRGGGGVDPTAFERAFSAIMAWQLMAAGFYHTFMPKERG